MMQSKAAQGGAVVRPWAAHPAHGLRDSQRDRPQSIISQSVRTPACQLVGHCESRACSMPG